MTQRERPDEIEARQIFEKLNLTQLEFADTNGGVDYVFQKIDCSGALEISRITRSEYLQGNIEWQKRGPSFEAPSLRFSWYISVSGYPTFRNIQQTIIDALACLERHEIGRYSDSQDWWIRHVPTLEDAVSGLSRQGVRTAQVIEPFRSSPNTSRVLLVPTESWMSDGPDGAVEVLNSFLESGKSDDNFLKLQNQNSDERHLWFWLDRYSEPRLRHPIEDPDRHHGLPTLGPRLPSHVTHLWLMDDAKKHGWMWRRNAHWTWCNRDEVSTDAID